MKPDEPFVIENGEQHEIKITLVDEPTITLGVLKPGECVTITNDSDGNVVILR